MDVDKNSRYKKKSYSELRQRDTISQKKTHNTEVVSNLSQLTKSIVV